MFLVEQKKTGVRKVTIFAKVLKFLVDRAESSRLDVDELELVSVAVVAADGCGVVAADGCGVVGGDPVFG